MKQLDLPHDMIEDSSRLGLQYIIGFLTIDNFLMRQWQVIPIFKFKIFLYLIKELQHRILIYHVTKRGFESEICLSVFYMNSSATYCFLGPNTKSIINLDSSVKLIHIQVPSSSVSMFVIGAWVYCHTLSFLVYCRGLQGSRHLIFSFLRAYMFRI